MNAPPLSTPRVEPFFFDADPGTRFSLYHAPACDVAPRGAILYVHPLAEELNRSRRMAALQARQMAALGYAVLQIDLFGCGDSCGDFSAARWDLWQRDLATALAWLGERSSGPLQLWGLRLGGLLALDFARTHPVDGILLWHPFLHGRSCVDQFLLQPRADGAAPASAAAERTRLSAQGQIDINGYELSAALAHAIDACDAAAMALPACPVHWFACGTPATTRLTAAAARLARGWAAHGATLHLHVIDGVPFWRGPQDACPALLAATGAVLAREAA